MVLEETTATVAWKIQNSSGLQSC